MIKKITFWTILFCFFSYLPALYGDSAPKKITLKNMTDQDFQEMLKKVSAFENGWKLTEKEMRERDFALSNGKTWAIHKKGKDGMADEWTESLVPVPFEKFIEKIPAERWGPNLADYIGGEIKPYGPGRQIERMVLKAPLKNLDMTKIEQIIKTTDSQGRLTSAKIVWEVKKSNNGSVITDIGHLTFSRYGKKYTKILFQSSHKLDTFPFNSPFLPDSLKNWLLGESLSNYFQKAIANYKKIASGQGFLNRLEKLFR